MLIYDEKEISRFFDLVLPPVWEETEAAFVSLAARRKYIPDGISLDLGQRPEMLDRDIVKKRNKDEYIAKIRRFTADGGYSGNDGKAIMHEAMAVYVNIHLSDTVSAWRKTKEAIADIDTELIKHAVSGNPSTAHALRMLKNVSSIWLTAMQNTYSRKRWIDYDIDITDSKDSETTRKITEDVFMECNLITSTIWIKTRGGYHILLSTETAKFSKAVNPGSILSTLQQKLEGYVQEAVINENGMIPLPGTMQGGKPVSIIQSMD